MAKVIATPNVTLDADIERNRYLAWALDEKRFSRSTYSSDAGIDKRTRTAFNTFVRTLKGRGSLSKAAKEAEMHQLADVVRHHVVHPLLQACADFSTSQTAFDQWHRQAVGTMIAQCPIQSSKGSKMTVGMAQKIINLHGKSLWALGVVPDNCCTCFHSAIDNHMLDLLDQPHGWVFDDNYEWYLSDQLRVRAAARQYGTYALVLESWYWFENSDVAASGRN